MMMHINTGSVQTIQEWMYDAASEGWDYVETIKAGHLVEVVWDSKSQSWVEA